MDNKLNYNDLGWLARAVLKRTQPVAFSLHILSLIWGGYFLWIHSVLSAGLCLGVAMLFGELVVHVDQGFYRYIKQNLNMFQRIVIHQTNSGSLIFHGVGFILYIVGCYTHSAVLLLGALSMVVLGHTISWFVLSQSTYIKALTIDE